MKEYDDDTSKADDRSEDVPKGDTEPDGETSADAAKYEDEWPNGDATPSNDTFPEYDRPTDEQMDRQNAENIVAMRNQQEILRQQNDEEGVRLIEEGIAKVPVSALDEPGLTKPTDEQMDRQNAENIVAMRNQQEILREQNDEEGVRLIEEGIAKVPVSALDEPGLTKPTDEQMDRHNTENIVAMRNQQEILRQQNDEEGVRLIEEGIAKVPVSALDEPGLTKPTDEPPAHVEWPDGDAASPITDPAMPLNDQNTRLDNDPHVEDAHDFLRGLIDVEPDALRHFLEEGSDVGQRSTLEDPSKSGERDLRAVADRKNRGDLRDYVESAAQADMARKEVDGWEPLSMTSHTSQVDRVTFKDGSEAYFKPAEGEDIAGRRDTAFVEGELWRNEIAVYEVDDALGFNLAPVTTSYFRPADGVRGSIAESVGDKGVFDLENAAPLDLQRGATLHYVTGNTDGHLGNVLSRDDSSPGIIDGGLCFPGANDYRKLDSLRSVFFPDVVGRPLDASIVDAARRVDQVRLAERLGQLGLSPEAIGGALGRLDEVVQGVITGAAYPGRLVDDDWNTVKKGRRS